MHVCIIGNGISGITAARYIRKMSDHEITVVSGESDYFFSRTALMYVYMGHMRFKDTQPYENWFWEKNRIQLKKEWVKEVDTDNKTLNFQSGESLSYDKLIIASGSVSNKFGWPGQDLPGVHGMYSKQDLEELEEHSANIKRAVIVGGGLIGIELAEMLHSRHIPVTLLVREKSYWDNVLPAGESALVTRHIYEHGFDLRLSEELKEIIAGADGRVSKIITKGGEEIECQFVGLTAGVSPNVAFLKESKIELKRGVLVNLFQETNVEDVYAIGDCAQFREPVEGRRPIEQVWYTGKMQGQVAAKNICGQRTAYDPGHWFNSAKFLDIEYQTYGMVMPKLREGEQSFYWEHQEGKICMHFVYREDDRRFVGVNTFGIRLRHEIFDRFLRDQRNMDYVLENLKAANFDPEFYSKYEEEIVKSYNEQTGSNLKLKNKTGLKAALALLGFGK